MATVTTMSSSTTPSNSQLVLSMPDYDLEKSDLTIGEEEASRQRFESDHGLNLVDWDGPDDPDMPLNWPALKKWRIIILLSIMTLLTPFGSSMFAPAIPAVMSEFNTTIAAQPALSSFIISVWILGYAFGPLIIAPLSELYGRLVVYHCTTALFIVFNIACALSTSIDMLIVFRFLAGVAGSCPLTVGSGSIADLFRSEERGKVMSCWTLPVLLGPTLGPVVGGYLSEALGWRWNFWFLAIATGVVFIFMLAFSRETYAPVLLARKVERLRKETGNLNLRSAQQSYKTPGTLIMSAIIRPLKMLFLSPIILGLSIYVAICYGYLYLLFTTISEVFTTNYSIPASNVGLVYLGIGAGQFLGVLAFGHFSDRIAARMTAANNGVMKPEFRLPPLIPGGLLLPVGLLIYGWTAQYHVHWIVPILGTTVVGVGIITVFMPVGLYLVDAFTVYAASASAANTVFRSLGGALLPLCGTKMFDVMGLGWGCSLLAFVALALLPVMWLFMRHGEQIRTKFELNL